MNLYHYSNISNSYNSNFFYSEDNIDYQEWLLSIIITELNLTKYNYVVDIGAGTCSFSNKLFTKANLTHPILCIDNNINMLNVAKKYDGVITQCCDANTFASQHNVFDRILFKEVIHHIPISSMTQLFKDIKECLSDDGISLIITRPSEVDYPLFNEARVVWRKNQLSKDILLEKIKDSGLNVIIKSVFKNITITKDEWYNMIRRRVWSTFSYFNDTELEKGIAELEIEFANKNEISFNEELLLFIIKKEP
jgi:cyclopropane fatty-acyl-phospholipid synthase-like methyltransferase